MGCCNFNGRSLDAGTSCDSSATDSRAFVQAFLHDKQVDLISHVGYGHKQAEYYIRANGVRISLFWDNESQAWNDASNRLKELIPEVDLDSILK